MAEVMTIRVYWDERPGATPGWYAELRVGDRVVTDSQKIDFLVAVAEDYGRDEAEGLEAELRAACPGARVVIER
jgi:hypothetical protein